MAVATPRGWPTSFRLESRTRILGQAAWSAYLAFDHRHPVLGNVDLRRALAHAVDRSLPRDLGESLVIATGGIVPPALQGHTPDIVPPSTPIWREVTWLPRG